MHIQKRSLLSGTLGVLLINVAAATPPGFVKSTIPLSAPPVGLAFDSSGVLYALEGAPFGSNEATLRTILPNGSSGNSFAVHGDDSSNFFVGAMAYDPVGDRVLISDNTADGRLYAVDKLGAKQTIASGIAGIAGVAVRNSGEIFVSTSPFGSAGEVLQVDRSTGIKTSVLPGLGYGAGLAFDLSGNLIVQDADTSTFQGRLQRLPISDTAGGITFGAPVPLISNMQSSAGVVLDGEGDLFTTGNGGLYLVDGSPLVESSFDTNGNAFQFATAIAFHPGSQPFDRFSGSNAGRLAFMADFGFSTQDEFVTLITPAQPGDYNLDGHVDANDYTTWQSAFGSTANLSADGNNNGSVDTADYVLWRKSMTPNASASTSSTLPEPTPVQLLFMALPALALVYHCRRRRPGGMVP
jgi:hypothetical protein